MLFSLREAIFYHAAREQFLARLGRVLIGGQVLLGTAAVASLADLLPGAAIWLASAGAFAGVVLLVLDPAGAAREHRILRGRFHDLLADCEENECGAVELRALKARKERIAAGAPPAYRAVQALAYNAAVNAAMPEADAARYRYRVGYWRRLMANLFPMRGMRWTLEKPSRD